MKWWQSALDKVLCPDLIHLMDTINKLYVAHASVLWAVFTLCPRRSVYPALSDVRQERSTALASPSSALFWKLVNERLNASTWQLLPSYVSSVSICRETTLRHILIFKKYEGLRILGGFGPFSGQGLPSEDHSFRSLTKVFNAYLLLPCRIIPPPMQTSYKNIPLSH